MNANRKKDIDHDFYDGFAPMTLKPVEPKTYREPCTKCDGKGFIPAYGFRENGRCYQCDGAGWKEYKQPADVRAKNRVRAAASRVARLERDFEAFEAEHPIIAAWWTGSTFPFAVSLREACKKYGRLTEGTLGRGGQLAAAYKCAHKFNESKSARREPVAVDVSAIERAFDKGYASGLDKVKIRLLANGVRMLFQPANANAKPENQGAIYVKDESNDTYLGKVKDGKFYRSRACSDEQYAAVIAACQAPEESAVSFGKTFGSCSCCGRTLTNELSIQLGIGPICRGKFFG
jgi:hypothetical protein